MKDLKLMPILDFVRWVVVTHRELGSSSAGGRGDLCVGLKAYKKACIGGLSNSQPTGSESKLSITYSVCAL